MPLNSARPPGRRICSVRYPKECVLKDCQEAVIRLLAMGDEEALAAFYNQIPAEDRWCMRYDATPPEILQKWFLKLQC